MRVGSFKYSNKVYLPLQHIHKTPVSFVYHVKLIKNADKDYFVM